MLKADYLYLLTDVDCLYTDNPRTNPEAKPVSICRDILVLKQQGKKLIQSYDILKDHYLLHHIQYA